MEAIGYQASRSADLDALFAALADPTRRAILSRLAAGQASVSEIAAPFAVSQPAISKHLKVLERAGLIERDVDEQRRPARLSAEKMALAVSWLNDFKSFWEQSFDQLDDVLADLRARDQDSEGAERTAEQAGRARKPSQQLIDTDGYTNEEGDER
jgi:DNA-binding transcriptional ArsR family regulator